jgi:hypothetical protein
MHGYTQAVTLAAHASGLGPHAHAHGDAIIAAAILGALGITLWVYSHTRRLISWLIAAATALVAAGLITWRDALVGITSSGTGLAILFILVFISPVCFYYEAIHHPVRRRERQAKRRERLTRRSEDGDEKAALALKSVKRASTLDGVDHHHHIRTPAIAAVFGTVVTLTIISFGALLTEAREVMTGAADSFAQSSSAVRSGKAAAAMPHSTDSGILFAGLVVFAIVIYGAHRAHKWRIGEGKKAQKQAKQLAKGGGGGKGGQRGLPGGNGAAGALPPGMGG